MALTILNQTRRFSWPFIASAGLHASVVAALLYATVPPMSLPSAVEQPMIVMLVAPDPQPVAPEPEVAPQPVPEPEPEPVPEPPAPVQVPKPVPKPKPKPKPERHREIKPRTPKPETRPASPAPSAPRATFRSNPIYPPRARALGIEGRISVMYDVNAEGRVENIRIVAAQPRNMFERDVRLAMRRWTYETGKPTANMTVKFQFDIQGVSSGD
ncbi:TonB family protein [Sodalis sp. (in: enterobacteria)]|uniref:TonB family protein n=1 Tax=Sodalis sp. (in: enterobacteria) TaxID=1898979 RepID=UPI003F3FE692